MKIYIAGRSEDRAKIAEIKRELESADIEVAADWIAQAGDLVTPADPVEARRLIDLDLRQVAECDIFVLFKPVDSRRDSSGGHHVETGVALALGKPVFLIGSAENLFHVHENVREFDSVQAAIHAILCFDSNEFKPSPHAVDSYQRFTRTTALYPGNGEKKTSGIAYLAVGLGGEAGEIVDKILAHLSAEETRLLTAGGMETQEQFEQITNLGEVTRKLQSFSYIAKQLETLKRPMREGKMPLPEMTPIPEEICAGLKLEFGDPVWYLARMADELGFLFSEILAANEEKLLSRRIRGVLHGSGDNR